jgi:hypothetical protein
MLEHIDTATNKLRHAESLLFVLQNMLADHARPGGTTLQDILEVAQGAVQEARAAVAGIDQERTRLRAA